MKLKPMKQWICDVCGEIIERPEDGYVQFHRNEHGQYDDFIIVHHRPASPRKNLQNACYKYSSDSDLESFLGDHGKVELLSLLDPGVYHLKQYRQMVADIRKWNDFFMRLQLPYYEEARKYWSRASIDGYFADSNEIYIYLPENLKRMIQHYEKEDNY